jgi:16S rRNA (adenine1518-N6/adenine1519-N6)-dimethyltransferase
LLWALPQLDRMAGVIIMVQLEFAQRVVAGVGTKAYGSLSVFTQLRSKTDFEAKVDRACFSPVPAVDSAIISLTPIKSEVSIDMLQKVETVTRTCFMQRRKMLRNGIKQWIKNQNEVDCPIDLNRRPETLTPAEFVRLTQFLFAEES